MSEEVVFYIKSVIRIPQKDASGVVPQDVYKIYKVTDCSSEEEAKNALEESGMLQDDEFFDSFVPEGYDDPDE